MNENYLIRKETPKDFLVTETLVRDAFWNVYKPGCTEHFVLHCYRDQPDFVPELSLVMEVGGKIIGQIMYVRTHIDCDDGREIDAMTFGPMCIAPDFQKKGYGKILLDFSMEKAKEMGADCLLICGNIDFYGKSGFVPAVKKGILYAADAESDAPYFLCKELTTDFLRGVTGSYTDPEGYFVAEKNHEEFEAYERSFPYKEKIVRAGQLASSCL